MKIFVQLLAILELFNKIEILNIFGKLTAQKRETTFWKRQDRLEVVIFSRTINVKVD